MHSIQKKITLALIAILAISTMGMSAVSPVAAQGSSTSLLARLDGLKSANARKYISADQFNFATPAIATSTPSPSSGTRVVTITVLEFETASQASTAFQLASNPMLAGTIAGEPDATLDGKSIADMGDQAKLYLGNIDYAGRPETLAVLFVLDGNLGYIITGYGSDAKVADTVSGFAAFMLERKPGSDQVTVHQRELATGSTFDLMPTRTDTDVIGNLIPMYDYDLLHHGESPLEDTATPTT